MDVYIYPKIENKKYFVVCAKITFMEINDQNNRYFLWKCYGIQVCYMFQISHAHETIKCRQISGTLMLEL